MEWRISQDSRTNEYVAEYGAKVESQPVGGGRLGYYMPAFIVYNSACFDTEKQAKAYIKQHPNG